MFIFIRLAIDFQICEIPRNSGRIRTYSRSRSSKVINLNINRKRICDFLL